MTTQTVAPRIVALWSGKGWEVHEAVLKEMKEDVTPERVEVERTLSWRCLSTASLALDLALYRIFNDPTERERWEEFEFMTLHGDAAGD